MERGTPSGRVSAVDGTGAGQTTTGLAPWTLAAIAAHARARPRHPAVIDDSGAVGYGELWARAGAVAAALADAPGPRVAIATGRGLPFIAAALGAWRAGRAYVPLDLLSPPARLRLIVDDSRPAALLVSEETAGADLGAPELPVPTTAPPEDPDDIRPAPDPGSERDAGRGDAPAYVIYTSGTTGVPKGVVVGHGSLGNLGRFMADRYGVGPDDRMLHVCSVGFDASVLEIWPTLAAGGTVVACSDTDRMRPEAAAAQAARHGCTLSVYPTGMASAALASGRVPPLRVLFFGGERMVLPAPPPARPLMSNVYGPTECTVIATTYDLREGKVGDEPPIGRPIHGVRIRLCDPAGHEVAPGEPGEVCIGGAAVAHGYLDRPELTAQRFVSLPGVDGRWYRTGDLARWAGDQLVFLGRLDQEQLKVRGIRVEAGEIEAALVAHEQVRGAAVATVGTGEGSELVAVLVPAGEPPTERGLRRHLLTRLPATLLPDRYVTVDRLPLTNHGKLDRAAVTAIAEERR